MKDLFVSLEIAKELEKIGFEEFCIGAYDIYSMLHIINPNNKFSLERDEIMYYAPTYEQVFKWFRDKGIYSEIRYDFVGNIVTFDEEGIQKGFYLKPKSTYEETRENLILEMIKLYIENKK